MTKIMAVLLVGTMVAFCGCSLEKKPKVLQVTEGEDGQSQLSCGYAGLA